MPKKEKGGSSQKDYGEGIAGIPMYRQGKEVPPVLVALWGISIWVCIFGTMLLFWTFRPCEFVEIVVGGDTIAKMRDPSLRSPPCSPSVDEGCKVWGLNSREECLCLLSGREEC